MAGYVTSKLRSPICISGLRSLSPKFRELRETIEAGIGQLERGEYTEYDPASVKALAGAVRDRGRRRLTRLRQTGTR